MTEYLIVDGGTLAYELTGTDGPLVLLAHGIGDSREAYRFVAPALAAAGCRVAAVDLRGSASPPRSGSPSRGRTSRVT